MNEYISGLEASLDSLPGQKKPWLADIRAAALSQLKSAGLPNRTQENWKYTETRGITRNVFPAVSAPGSVNVNTALDGVDAHQVTIVDGHLVSVNSLEKGINIVAFADALEDEAMEPVVARLGQAMPADIHGFNALSLAWSRDGLVLHVEEDAHIEKPIQLNFIASTNGDGHMAMPRVLMVIDKGAKVKVIERHLSAGKGNEFVNLTGETFVGAGAICEHIKIQQQAETSTHVGGWFGQVEADAQYLTHSSSFGGKLVRNDWYFSLVGERADARIDGVYIGRRQQHIDNFTRIEHSVANCTSDELYKGVLAEKAHAVFHGRIIVEPDAQQTNAYQTNRNLLLSRNARADTKPQLEIYADDVKCSHGATVGQLDEESLFYLRSRGLSEVDAHRLLVHAFVGDVLLRLEDKALESFLAARVSEHLQGAGD